MDTEKFKLGKRVKTLLKWLYVAIVSIAVSLPFYNFFHDKFTPEIRLTIFLILNSVIILVLYRITFGKMFNKKKDGA